MTPQEQMRAELDRRRVVLEAQRTAAAQRQAEDEAEIVDAEIVEE